MSELKTLWLMHGGECFYCGLPTWLPSSGESMLKAKVRLGVSTRSAVRDREATREHLQRRADGGPDVMQNYVLACRGCNSRRGAKPVLTYFAEMRAGKPLVCEGVAPA